MSLGSYKHTFRDVRAIFFFSSAAPTFLIESKYEQKRKVGKELFKKKPNLYNMRHMSFFIFLLTVKFAELQSYLASMFSLYMIGNPIKFGSFSSNLSH